MILLNGRRSQPDEISKLIKKFIFFLIVLIPLYLFVSPAISFSGTKQYSRTPADAVENHINNLEDDNYFPEQSAKSLNSSGIGLRKAADQAIKLKKIFDGKGLYIKAEDLPIDPDYFDSSAGRNRFYPFKSQKWIYIEKYGSRWQYSIETVGKIEAVYDKTFLIELEWLSEVLPDFAFNKVFGLFLWQIAGGILLLFLSYPIYKLFNWLLGYLLVKFLKKKENIADLASYVKRMANPMSLLVVVLLLRPGVTTFQFEVKLSSILMTILNGLVPILLTIIGVRGADILGKVLELLALRTKSSVDDHLVPVIKNSAKILIVVMGCIYILDSLHVSITPLLAGVSIGGLAFALAAQDTVKNFFGSVMIFTDQPFEVGDWIVFEGKEGTVIQVGLRSTRIRTFSDSVIAIPNGKLADMTIDNMGRRQMRRFQMFLNIRYDTPHQLIDAFVLKLREIVESHPDTRKDNYNINITNLNENGVVVFFNVYLIVEDFTLELNTKQEIISNILSISEELGISFSFQQKVAFFDNQGAVQSAKNSAGEALP